MTWQRIQNSLKTRWLIVRLRLRTFWYSLKVFAAAFWRVLRIAIPSIIRLAPLLFSETWLSASWAVLTVIRDKKLNNQSDIESKVSFCPRCGQCPQDDRRLEEARELAIFRLNQKKEPFKLRDLNLSLEWHLWRRKV